MDAPTIKPASILCKLRSTKPRLRLLVTISDSRSHNSILSEEQQKLITSCVRVGFAHKALAEVVFTALSLDEDPNEWVFFPWEKLRLSEQQAIKRCIASVGRRSYAETANEAETVKSENGVRVGDWRNINNVESRDMLFNILTLHADEAKAARQSATKPRLRAHRA